MALYYTVIESDSCFAQSFPYQRDTKNPRLVVDKITTDIYLISLVLWLISVALAYNYLKTSSISRTKSKNLNVSCILLQLSSLNPLKPGVKLRKEDAVGAAPTSDAPTTSELSTILLPTKVRLILEVLR